MNKDNFNLDDIMNTPDTSGEYDTQDVNDNKIFAILSYLGILCFLPLIANGGQSRYGRFHANQGLILLIVGIAIGIVSKILCLIPVVGSILSWILSIADFVLMILGMVNAGTGKAKELPIIGGMLHVFDK